ncbi:DUF5405 family protein [Erwinia aphidicola]|uniref:DUF5405 family protein n=1 Tax=Erwinia aphidicola TaxID=68334 RepID=A0ABU8DL64_ERWAP
MKITIDDRFVIEGGAHDFILSELRIVARGDNKGQQTKVRLGYYAKLEQLIRALITHDVKQSDVQSIQAMQQHIDRIAMQCEKAFGEIAA